MHRRKKERKKTFNSKIFFKSTVIVVKLQQKLNPRFTCCLVWLRHILKINTSFVKDRPRFSQRAFQIYADRISISGKIPQIVNYRRCNYGYSKGVLDHWIADDKTSCPAKSGAKQENSSFNEWSFTTIGNEPIKQNNFWWRVSVCTASCCYTVSSLLRKNNRTFFVHIWHSSLNDKN